MITSTFFVHAASALEPGEYAPLFSAENLSGEIVGWSEIFQKKVTVLYFWDVRFQICHQGLEELQHIHKRYGNRLAIFAINIDSNARSDLEGFVKDRPWVKKVATLLLDRQDISQKYDAKLSVPVVCVINKNRKVAFYQQSFDWKKVKQAVEKLMTHKGLWIQYVWPLDDLGQVDDLQWGRGDVIDFAYLRESQRHWSFGLRAHYSYQNPDQYDQGLSRLMNTVSSGAATFSVGLPPLGRHFGVSFSGGAAGYKRSGDEVESRSQSLASEIERRVALESNSWYIAPVADLNLQVYLFHPISIYASGGADLRLIVDALQDRESLLRNEHVYRYEAGIRVYLTSKHSAFNIGYSQWRLGDRSVGGVQIAYGYIF